ncbi:MAG: PAS domain-containing protein [Thermodesulfobacteriota bacterium]
MKKHFGARLKTLRQLANLTQLELAELAGISDRYLGRMERGLVSPSFEIIDKLARALRIQPVNLFLFSPALLEGHGAAKVAPGNGGLLHMGRIGTFERRAPEGSCWISPAIIAMLGLPPSAARGLGRGRLLAHVEPEDRSTAESFLDHVFELRPHPLAALRIRRRDGQSRQLLVMAETAGHGGVIGTVADATDLLHFEGLLAASKQSLEHLVRDRTAHLVSAVSRLEGEVDLRSRTERSLLLSEREKASILSGLEGILIKRLSPDYKIIWANEAVEKLCGKPLPMLAGRLCHLSAMGNSVPCPGCPVAEAVRSRSAQDGDITTPDGRSWLARATPEMDDSGNVESVLFMGLDMTERMKARLALDDALRERTAMLKSFSGLTIKHVDRNMRIVWASACDPESPVTKGEDYLGLTCHKVFQKSDAPCPGCPLPETLATGQTREREHLAPNGRTFIVRCNPVFDHNGQVKGAIHMAFDISERKRMEQSLVQARMFLEHLLGSCAAVLYTCKPHGDFAVTYMSENVMTVFGHPAEAFTSDPGYWASCLFPGEREKFFSRLDELFGNGRLELEYRFRHGNGSWRWTRTDIRLTRDASGAPREIVGSWIDITGSKACELALRESESRYRNLFHSNKTVQLIIDAETGAILDANPAASDFYGYSLDELRRMNVSGINTLPPDKLDAELAKARDGRQNLFRFRHRLANGEVRDVESRITMLTQGGRLVTHSLIIDLGERPGK